MEKENVDYKSELNERQIAFCNFYVSEEFLGNGVQSYIHAYNIDPNDPKSYNSAKHSASLLLDNVNVCKLINSLLDDAGLNDQFVDKRLLFLISQNEDKGTSLGAIKEYNKMKGRITDKLEVKGDFDITLKLD